MRPAGLCRRCSRHRCWGQQRRQAAASGCCLQWWALLLRVLPLQALPQARLVPQPHPRLPREPPAGQSRPEAAPGSGHQLQQPWSPAALPAAECEPRSWLPAAAHRSAESAAPPPSRPWQRAPAQSAVLHRAATQRLQALRQRHQLPPCHLRPGRCWRPATAPAAGMPGRMSQRCPAAAAEVLVPDPPGRR